MKIPEKAPDWRAIYKKTPMKEQISLFFNPFEFISRANSEYWYWDKVKHKAPLMDIVDITPKQAWAAIKNVRQKSIQKIPFMQEEGIEFYYWAPQTAQRYLYKIDRGMEEVLAGLMEGQVAKEYQLNSIMEEAIASSQIEGAATTRAVAKEMLSSGRTPTDHSEKMIVNNFRTIEKLKGFLGQPLTPELIKEIHKSMTEDTLEDPKWIGEFRTEQNEIRDIDGTLLFTPPQHSEIKWYIKDICLFANNHGEYNFIHPAIKGIILHFLLAYVHPFMDGNGRTARALFYWYMLKHGYWLFEYLSISSVINKKRNQYLKAFLYSEIDDNDLTYFIMFHLKAIEEALDEVVAYIKRKKEEKKGAVDFLKSYPELNDRQLALLADALEKPEATYTFEKHSRVHGIVRQSARTDLLGLRDLGLLDMRKEGRKFVFIPASGLREKLRA